MESRLHHKARLLREQNAPDRDPSTDNDKTSDDDQTPKDWHNQLGLGFKQTMKQYGIVWLRADQLLWEGLPLFQPKLLEKLPLTKNLFYASFHVVPELGKLLTEREYRWAKFRRWCVPAATTYREFQADPTSSKKREVAQLEYVAIFSVTSEAILQSYFHCVIDTLIARARKCPDFPKSAPGAKARLLRPLDVAEAKGLRGLNYAIVQKMLRVEPRIAFARPARTAAGKNNIFHQYQNSGSWIDRIRGLFLFDDIGTSTRRWDTAAFRTLTRHIYSIFSQELGDPARRQFLDFHVDHAAQRLFIIPQYDLDKLSVLLKPNRGHGQDRQDLIRTLDPLDKTNWYCAAFPASHDREAFAIAQSGKKSHLPRQTLRETLGSLLVALKLDTVASNTPR